MASTYWTCRFKNCKHRNPGRKQKCLKCGRLKPPKKHKAHTAVLRTLTYDDFIGINGGEFCWIHHSMGLPDPPRKGRLHRDHDHVTGVARGLLCYRCNYFIPKPPYKEFNQIQWLEVVTDYLRSSDDDTNS